MEAQDVIWEGKIGSIPLRVGVPYAGRIIAEWDMPEGSRHKVADSVHEFERAVLFQLLLKTGTDEGETKEVIAAVEKAEAERPRRSPPAETRRRKNPKQRQHRRSRRPPRRR